MMVDIGGKYIAIQKFFRNEENVLKYLNTLALSLENKKILISNLYRILVTDNYFTPYIDELYQIYEESFIEHILSFGSISKVFSYLNRLGLEDELVKLTLVEVPEIFAFADNLDKIFVIFKDGRYHGIVIADGEECVSHYNLFDLESVKVGEDKSSENLKDTVPLKVNGFYKNTYLLSVLGRYLQRYDSMKRYSIEADDSFELKLNKMREKSLEVDRYHVK